MKIAYFDCSSGISGDMCLGALVDAGVPVKKLESELRKIPVKGWDLTLKKVKRAGFRATKVDVVQKPTARNQKTEAKTWKNIEKIIRKSSLSLEIKQKGLNIFRRLFEVEAKVHGERFDSAHLHELGAVDCIIDIFGTVIGLKILGIEKVCVSPVNTGSGFVKTAHGVLPVPAPATAELLKGIPVYSDGTEFELTTPTGAVIIKELSSFSGAMPEMTIERIGIGAGNKDLKNRGNVLRIFTGELSAHPPIPPLLRGGEGGVITVIETNIDDMNPQIYEYVMERLFQAGALDVYLTQIMMKKNRPGIKLTALCNNKDKDVLMDIILRETTTIGIRFYETNRRVLQREIRLINTKLGRIRVKVSKHADNTTRITPEYEDCKRLAKKLKIPLIDVLRSLP